MTAPTTSTATPRSAAGRVPSWPLLLLAAPAFVAIWSGWVGLGELTGFGTVRPLPGIWPGLELDTTITLPIGVETYAAYATRAWLTPGVPDRARRFARTSAIGALALGALGQVAYHLMVAAEVTSAPWPITTAVSCLPVAVLGMGAALVHLLRAPGDKPDLAPAERPPLAAAGESSPVGRAPAGEPVGEPGEATTAPGDHHNADAEADLIARAREVIAAADGRPLGRRALARELGCTEHRARTVLDAASGNGGSAGPGAHTREA